MNFYIVSDLDYQLPNGKWPCGGNHPSYLTVTMQQSYSLHWVAPKSEGLNFIFENYAEGSDFSVDKTVSFTLYRVSAFSSASTLYTTVGATRATSHQTKEVPFLQSNAGLYALSITGAVIAAFVLVYTMLGRRSKPPKTKPVEWGKTFCLNCGVELSPESKVCNKCGSAQKFYEREPKE